MSDCELFDERENIVVVREKVLLILILYWCRRPGIWIIFKLKKIHFLLDRQGRYEMGLLEIGSEVAVFGDISKELKSHEYILFSRH